MFFQFLRIIPAGCLTPFNRIFALLIFMSHFKSMNLYQNRPKIYLIMQKSCKISKPWRLHPQTPLPPMDKGVLRAAGGFVPRSPMAPAAGGYATKLNNLKKSFFRSGLEIRV